MKLPMKVLAPPQKAPGRGADQTSRS
jgi:hypothetical protein